MCSRAGTYWRHLVTLVLSPLFINIRVRDADSTCLDRKTNCWRETLQAAHHDPASHHLGIAAARLQTKLHLPESKAGLFTPTFQHICRCLNPHILLILFFSLQLCNYTIYVACYHRYIPNTVVWPEADLQLLHQGWFQWWRGLPLGCHSYLVSWMALGALQLVFICFLGPDAPCGHCSEDTVHVMFFQFCLLELHGVKLEVVIGWFLAVHYFDKCCIVAYRSILHFV